MNLGPVDVSLIAALVPVFIRGKAEGERFVYSKSTTINAAASKMGPALCGAMRFTMKHRSS